MDKLSSRQQQVLDSMEPGKWYTTQNLGTTRQTMNKLKLEGYIRKRIIKMPPAVSMVRPEGSTQYALK